MSVRNHHEWFIYDKMPTNSYHQFRIEFVLSMKDFTRWAHKEDKIYSLPLFEYVQKKKNSCKELPCNIHVCITCMM